MATTLLQQQTPVILTSPYTLRPDVATGSSTALDDFHLLVQQIKTYLGSSSGIDSKDIDVDILKTLMLRYTSNSVHWNKYAKVQPGKHYTRNSIENINGKANIVIDIPHENFEKSLLILTAASTGVESRKGFSGA
jgi:hypothetical protein